MLYLDWKVVIRNKKCFPDRYFVGLLLRDGSRDFQTEPLS
jgi:hypothetical protein